MNRDALEKLEARLRYGPLAEAWARQLLTTSADSAELRHEIAEKLHAEVRDDRIAAVALLETLGVLAVSIAQCYADAAQLPLDEILAAIGRAGERGYRPPADPPA